MHRRPARFSPLATLLLLTAWLAPALAAPPSMVPDPPDVEAGAWLLQDFQSGDVIADKNAEKRMEPASLTKMMTAYVVFNELESGNIALDDEVRVSKDAWRMPGSRMFVEVDSRVELEKLLKGMIIQSGNDASVALAEHVGGSEEAFASMMNGHAERLGMEDTRFTNASGMPEEDHYTTPRDMARLARALVNDFPDHYEWYSQRKYTYNGITQYNRNKLLWRNPQVDGLKTGHTESAGYSLVTSAQREDMRLISVVMDTESEEARARESNKLINYGFRFFATHKLYDGGEELTETRVWKGRSEQLPLGIDETLWVTIPRGRYDALEASMSLDRPIMAPASAGETYGTLHIEFDGEPLTERPLRALEGVEEGSLWNRLVDNAVLLFR
ncbi:MAG: D-alanyl-D-alanine carboxypeptidase family protein [Thiohalospira sp.]|uniref:D-alanyl-D-alanine carboxypeptidase family protein n=1 Tax=Thiohalospira sp. TaxID=3080549 RepID=UPI00397ED0C8